MDLEEYLNQKWKSVSAPADESENLNGSMDCNICLDHACDPVVTLCGHLYCWPCIYKWFHFQSASLASDEPPQCPVCKAEISHTTLVPLYGRGQSNQTESVGKSPYMGMVIPPRPQAIGTQGLAITRGSGQQLLYRNPYQNQQYNLHPSSGYVDDSQSPLFNFGGTDGAGYFHPVVGMFGDMVYARVFGNTESLYAYPNSYSVIGSSNTRSTRQEMQVKKSLNRLWIFFLCCSLLCLLLF